MSIKESVPLEDIFYTMAQALDAKVADFKVWVLSVAAMYA
eukprot:SAG31_NODE_86_length_26973_cov_16.850897_7_plen_40_part_00